LSTNNSTISSYLIAWATVLRDLIVKVPDFLFYVTLMSGLLFMGFLCSDSLIKFSFEQSALLNKLTFVLDVSLLQILSALGLIFVIKEYLFGRVSERKLLLSMGSVKRIVIITAILLVAFVLVGEYASEHLILKPIFNKPRADTVKVETLEEPWLTSFLLEQIRPSSEGRQLGAPSGYCLRQWLMTLIFLLYFDKIVRRKTHRKKKILCSIAGYSICAFLFLFVAFSRVYRGAHSFFDVGIALGVGTFFFWFFYILPGSLLIRNDKYLRDLLGISLVYFGSFFYFSNSSYRWAYIAFFLYPFLGIFYFLSTHGFQRSKLSKEEREVRRKIRS